MYLPLSLVGCLPICLDASAVAVPAARLAVARPSSTAVSAGYVPDGLTQKQWDEIKNKKASAAAASKKKVAAKKFEVSLSRVDGVPGVLQPQKTRLYSSGKILIFSHFTCVLCSGCFYMHEERCCLKDARRPRTAIFYSFFIIKQVDHCDCNLYDT